jgi:hypothetical protein
MAETYNYDDYDDYNDADKSAWLDTTDVQGNNIDSKFWSEATKALLTWWAYLIRKAFANSQPHKKK